MKTQNSCIIFIQCSTSVEDVVPTLYNCNFPVRQGCLVEAGSVVGQHRRRWASIESASGHTVTNTRRCIFVFRVTCKPFLAGHCTMYVTEINKDIINVIQMFCIYWAIQTPNFN